MSGKESYQDRTLIQETDGTRRNLIQKYRDLGKKLGKSVYVGQRWINGQVVGYGIWMYKTGEKIGDDQLVATGRTLDELYGN